MQLKISSLVDHRSRSVQSALAPLGIGAADGVGILAPGGCTCTFGCSCSCSCGAVTMAPTRELIVA